MRPVDQSSANLKRGIACLLGAALLLPVTEASVACDALQPTGGVTQVGLQTVSFTGASTLPWSNSKWKESRAKYYTPTITLTKPLPVDMVLNVWVKEDKKMESDDLLGKSKVRFNAGQTTGKVTTANDSEARQRGFPAVTNGKFWLVSTKERKVKGNVGKGDDDHAKVYIEVRFGSKTVNNHGYAIGPWNTCDVKGQQSTRKTVRVDEN